MKEVRRRDGGPEDVRGLQYESSHLLRGSIKVRVAMTALSALEFAALVPCTVDYVERLHRLDLLEVDDDGLYVLSGVHIVRLMAAFEEVGVSLDDVARGVSAGQLIF